MRKINKKSASLVALQLGASLSPLSVLTQVSADTLDDTVAKARQAGINIKIEDEGVVKASSKPEAEAKNAEAEARLKSDTLKASQMIDDYISEKTAVQKKNQDAQTHYEEEVKTETKRVAMLEAENQKIITQNTEAQKTYEAEKARVDAQNAEAQKAYEAEKARVDAQNAEAQKAYEAEKARVDAQNAEKVRTYESELVATKAANAKLLAQYEDELKKAKEAHDNKQSIDAEIARIKAENEKAQKEYESELARITAERDTLTKNYETEKARIEKENATSVKTSQDDAARIEAAYQAELAVYNQKVKDITAQNQKAQADYEANKKTIEAKNAKIDADYAAAQKVYETKLAEVTASNKAKQDAYDKALADYKAGKLDTVTNKEKTLAMKLPNVPSDVTVRPVRTIEKDLTSSTNLTADLKAAEDEFKSEEAKVNAKLQEYTNTPAEEPVDPVVRSLVTKELKSAKDWADEQNKLGQPIGVRYVIKERLVTGKDATLDAIKTAYTKAKTQMDNDALVSQHFDSATRPGGYNWTGSKNRFIQKWADIKQTYDLYLASDDAKKAAELHQKLKVVDFDLTELDGYDKARQSTATGTVNASDDDNLPPEVATWMAAHTAKRNELRSSSTNSTGSNTANVEWVDSATYKAKVDEFNKKVADIRAEVNTYNTERKQRMSISLANDLNATLGSSNSGNRVINDNNMTFTKSSDRVKYLRSQNFTTLDDAMNKGFDIANAENSESATPVENQLAKVKFTAVRIPKGESVTVEYVRKDGKDYLSTGDFLRETMFVSDSDYNKKDTFTREDEKSLSKIRYTVRNDGSISSDGDIIAFFMNDTAIPTYFGISNMGSPEGSNRFKLMSDPRQLFGMTTTTEFVGSGNETLRTTVKELSIDYPDQTDPGTFKFVSGKRFVKGELPAVDSAPVKEYVARPDNGATINDHGTRFGNSSIPVENVNNLANNWKDTESWSSNQTGWDGAKLINHLKSYNKPHVDKAVNPTVGRYQVSEVETGFYNMDRGAYLLSPMTPKFPYRPNDGTYVSARPVGELVRTIEVPVVRGEAAATTPREITPIKMVIKYKEVKNGVEPTKPTLEQLPTEPPVVAKEKLPTPPTPTPLPNKPTKGDVSPTTTKPLPQEPKLPELPKKPTPKPLPNVVSNVVEPKKPELKQEPSKPTQIPEPKKPEVLVSPAEPKPKETPKPPVLKTITKIERKVIEKPKLQEEPKAPNIKLSKVQYIYEPKTIWETVDGKVLRSWEDGEKPKDNFNGYEYVRTIKDNDGNIHHIYKPVEKPQEQPKMKTIWETVDGKVLRSWEDGEKPKDNFDGYEYVRTDKDNDGNIHHIYKPVEKPQEQPKIKTIWKTVDGKVLRSWEDGEKPKDNFNGYEYVRTIKDNDGNIHHIYKPVEKPQEQPKMKTIWETVDGKVLRLWEDGKKPKDTFDGYEYVRTDKDNDGNIHHIYKPVEKPQVTPKELPKTGDVGIMSNILGSIFAMGGLLGFKRRKRKKQ